ncbi:hypothetical protein [Desulfolucanica intricata]|uniref:hypothetical protein n=1 Tax=Desulfolucanica intricata TaxID=1285191 RepID=UPI00083095AD|nr:hypothetical protein [Desulfolucanica intricata]
MGITFVRLSAPSHVKEKLDEVLQETGKSINEIVNTALEKYLTEEYGLIVPQKEPDFFSIEKESLPAEKNEDLSDSAENNDDADKDKLV